MSRLSVIRNVITSTSNSEIIIGMFRTGTNNNYGIPRLCSF